MTSRLEADATFCRLAVSPLASVDAIRLAVFPISVLASSWMAFRCWVAVLAWTHLVVTDCPLMATDLE